MTARPIRPPPAPRDRGRAIARGGPPGTAAPVLAVADAERSLSVAWAFLAALALARAALTFVPSMWLWGLGAQRFLAPWPAWGLWAPTAIALAPALARPLTPWAARLGDALEDAPVMSALAWAATAAALTWMLPDRLHFVGDFQVRLNALESEGVPISRWAHVALPLEVMFHERLVNLFRLALGGDVLTATRLLGALEAGFLGALAARFARALRLRGPGALAAGLIVLFGGALTIFTGYNKAFMETALLTACVGLFGLRVVREGRGMLPLGLSVAAALASHRSGLTLLVPLAAAWVMAWKTHDLGRTLRRPAGLLALAAPALTLVLMAPDILAALRQFDRPHLVPAEVHHGLLAATLGPARLLELVNLTLELSPLAIVIPAWLLLGRSWRIREHAYLIALLLPSLGLMIAIHTHQGLFRDLDCFAPAGIALSLLAAALAGRALACAPRHTWLAVAVALGVTAPAVQWLLLPADLERGLARVRAFVEEPPPRAAGERGETWDFLGIRYLKLGRYREAALAFGQAALIAPSPRILTQWAVAESNLGHVAAAQALYRRVVERDPRSLFAWLALGGTSLRLQQLDEARNAAARALELAPGDPQVLALVGAIDRAAGAR